MNIQAELSYYPLINHYEKEIDEFIGMIEKCEKLGIVHTAMSTQVFGDYEQFFEILNKKLIIKDNSVLHIKLSNSCPLNIEQK